MHLVNLNFAKLLDFMDVGDFDCPNHRSVKAVSHYYWTIFSFFYHEHLHKKFLQQHGHKKLQKASRLPHDLRLSLAHCHEASKVHSHSSLLSVLCMRTPLLLLHKVTTTSQPPTTKHTQPPEPLQQQQFRQQLPRRHPGMLADGPSERGAGSAGRRAPATFISVGAQR